MSCKLKRKGEGNGEVDEEGKKAREEGKPSREQFEIGEGSGER